MRQNHSQKTIRDHGGGLNDPILTWGGTRADWVDLSTGINPLPYPLPDFTATDWTDLPDTPAQTALLDAARSFWNVPDDADILAAPGASALIAAIPRIFDGESVYIPGPTYNEHAAAFRAHGWAVDDQTPHATRVLVHPNNPDGRLWSAEDVAHKQVVIDESFADICPEQSLIAHAANPGCVILKSFGKFWGLAGLRLGFAISTPETIAQLRELIGPWAVSGPALRTGTKALRDLEWARETRARLNQDAQRLDAIVERSGARTIGGTALFRLYDTDNAALMQDKLASHHIWSRIFPYSETWLRLGVPGPGDWHRIEMALST